MPVVSVPVLSNTTCFIFLNISRLVAFRKRIPFFAARPSPTAIAAGVALALKKKGSKNKVWCFIGDGAEDEGHFYEAARYVDGWDLPCTFIIEDNNRSVDTPKKERYGKNEPIWPKSVRRYSYTSLYPHVGTDKWIDFSGKKEGKYL